jgi:hypothetical protein
VSTFVVVVFNVTGWKTDQIGALRYEAIAQGEANDDHPEAPLACDTISGDATVIRDVIDVLDASPTSDRNAVWEALKR